MNEYYEAFQEILCNPVEALDGKEQLGGDEERFLLETEKHYTLLASTLESGLATVGIMMGMFDREYMDQAEIRDLGHFITALVPTCQTLRDNATLARNILVEHGLNET